MIDFFSTLPHCSIFGNPALGASLMAGNILIALAYYIIPVSIVILARRRDMKPHKHKIAYLFALFILSCGTGHILEALALSQGGQNWEWVVAGMNAFTAAVSLFTAGYVVMWLPSLIHAHQSDQDALKLYRDGYFKDNTGRERKQTCVTSLGDG